MENKNNVKLGIKGFLTCIHTLLKNSLHPHLLGSRTPLGCQSASQSNTTEREKTEFCQASYAKGLLRKPKAENPRVEVKSTRRVLLHLQKMH